MQVKKVYDYFKKLFVSYQFGFIRGHSYITNRQILQIKQALICNKSNEIVKTYEKRMTALIGSGYGISFAAGRMAFYSLLKVLNIGVGDEVILPGFTCSVMPNAIWRVGATPVFADIDKETFGSDAIEIEKKITPQTKLIVAQHSFGIPCNIHPIIELGKKHNIFVMEDCAITLDSEVKGTTVGNLGDAAIFSTDHSKPLNTLIGGFLYTKSKSIYKKIKEFSVNLKDLDKTHQERLYNQFLYERRNFTPEHYSRSILKMKIKNSLRKLSFWQNSSIFLDADSKKHSSSNTSYPYPAKMPLFLAQLGLFELDRWYNEKNRRKNLLKKYLDISGQSNINNYLPNAYFNPDLDIVPLRFVFQYPDSKKLIKIMNNFIDIRGIWFQTPIISCPDGPESLGYSNGCCSLAETIGNHIINWPCVVNSGWESKILNLFRKAIY